MSTFYKAFWPQAGRQTTSPTTYECSPTVMDRRPALTPIDSEQPVVVDLYKQAFLNTLGDKLLDPRYTDLTLVGQVAVFKVHKLIVCPQAI